MIRHTLPGSCPTVQACTCEPVPRTSADARGTERCRCSRPVAIPPLCQGLRCVRGDRQILSCILYSYHTSFCMPVSDMHIVQLSHFILHACFSSTSHPLRSLFNPQARLTQGGQRLGSECQHRVCTLLQHMVWHNLVSESGCRERQRLACTIVCYYTSLCVPVFQIRHTRQGVTYCPLCIRACARRQCSRSHRRCSPPSTSHLFAQACSACDATDRV